MRPSEYYRTLLEGVTEELERSVFMILAENVGVPVARGDLIARALADAGPSPSADRKIRKAIENLRLRKLPIVSTSGDAGYALVDDVERIDQYIAEESARVEHIQRKIAMLREARGVAVNLAEYKRSGIAAIQSSMFP